MKAVVLCAGAGTRLGALTATTPKPMLQVGGEPLLAHTLRHLARHGFDWVAVNLHFMPEVIPAYFGDGARYGVRLHYTREETLLGTAGTVRGLSPLLADAPEVLVVYGDLLFDEHLGDLVQRHHACAADATLLLHQRAGSNSLVRMDDDGRIRGFIERPDEKARRANPYRWVNSGIAVLGPRAVAAIPDRVPADLPRDVYAPLVDSLRLFGVSLSGYRCAIDSPARLARANADFQAGLYAPSQRGAAPPR